MNKNPVRPVTIASICGRQGNDSAFMRLVEQAAAQKPDLILLPETWQNKVEAIDSPVIQKLREIARKNHTYILHATEIAAPQGKSYNTALLFDRNGEIAGRYDKIYPYWGERCWDSPGAMNQPVINCDFGRVAVFICFDANFPDIWANAGAQGADLVVWSSAYGAGRQLQAHALNHHYPIVTSTLSGNCMVFDINGQRLIDVHCDQPFVQWVTLDLDRCIFHENFNTEKLNELLSQPSPSVEVEEHWTEEQWIIVRSAKEGVSAREVCRQAGLEELRDYKRRSRAAIDAIRSKNASISG